MEHIKRILIKLYGLGQGVSIERIDAGYLSTNFKVTDNQTLFFLKGYRNSIERVAEIHQVKQYFASQDIPVILPISSSAGGTYFESEGVVYALFPYSNGIHYNRGSISDSSVVEIAHLIASMHRVSMGPAFSIKTTFEPWDDRKSLEKADSILALLEKKNPKNDFDFLALKNIELKKRAIHDLSCPFNSLTVEPFILLHGDFHDQNIFFNSKGEVQSVFDFGEAKMGPRAHELWRSADFMFLEGLFNEGNIRKVILYFKSYNEFYPIKREVLEAGFVIYFQKHIHGFWVEGEHYLKGNVRVDRFLETRATGYLIEHGSAFSKQVLDGVYGKQKTA